MNLNRGVTAYKNVSPLAPRLSLNPLGWGCCELFSTLDWPCQQNVPKDQYELIWMELYDRVIDEVMEKAAAFLTCNQHGIYHNHIGYNVGVLQAQGE